MVNIQKVNDPCEARVEVWLFVNESFVTKKK